MSNQDKKPNLSQRIKMPQTLAASLGTLINNLGGRASDADLANNWRGVVGNEIANISSVVAIRTTRNKKFNIILRPVSPAFALELSYKIADCTKAINNYYGTDIVDKITIRK